MEVLLLIFRIIIAAVFSVAAVGKILDPVGSEKALVEFGLPRMLVRPSIYGLPILEMLVAVSMIFVETSWFGAVGAVGLFSMFSVGMIYQMARGNTPDCHCFGQIHSEPVSWISIARNLAFSAIAIPMIVAGRDFQGFDIKSLNEGFMQYVIGIAVVGLLVAVVHFLNKISEQQTQIMRRIELMELVSQDGGTVERDEVSHPHEGLPIGAQFPDFELPNLAGKLITYTEIKADATPTLFLFVSPTCNPCRAMVPEFEQWQKDMLGKVKLIFISNGKPEANIEKFGGSETKQILLQKDRELAEAVKAQWTPTAVFVDAKGRIASHATAGDTAIRQLVGQIKSEDFDGDFTHFTHEHEHNHTVNKIGSSVPEFSAEDISGREIGTDYFKGKKTLVAFWSLTCPFCIKMMDELKDWDKTKGADAPDLVVFSEGDRKAHVDFGLRSPVILDEGYKTAAQFGMFGTPSAVLVNEDGKIVSETAIGSSDIWSLVGVRQ